MRGFAAAPKMTMRKSDENGEPVIKVLDNGQQVNIFDLRDKTNSVFEPIPGGNINLIWSGAFGFDLTLYQERSEPRWTA